jgi:hypothetical protein
VVLLVGLLFEGTRGAASLRLNVWHVVSLG